MPQYLVTIDIVDGDPLLPIGQFANIVREKILPSLDALEDLQAKGKVVAGGYPMEERHMVLIIEAESEDEVQRMLEDLPITDIAKVNTSRLRSLKELRSAEIDNPFPF